MPVLAQTSASMQGTVKDVEGQPVKGAIVEIQDKATGAVWKQTTNEKGFFLEPILAPGTYDVTASAEENRSWEQHGINLAVGQRLTLQVMLRTKTEVVVAAEAGVQLDLSSGALSVVVGKSEIRDLPLNGRSFEQLALLQPGIVAAYSAGSSFYGARTRAISINGARPEQSGYLLDGTNIQNAFNKTPGSSAGVLLGVESVLEYQVLTNAYSPEFGRAAGGVVNAATRGGANQLHGTLFHFHRNSAFDAKNYFNAAGEKIPGFKRNQFGAVAGGAIRKDRTFYFGSWEQLVERLGVISLTAVPDAAARQGVLPSGTVTVNPFMRPFVDTLFPLPNGASLGGGAAEYRYSLSQPTEELFFQGRVDHKIGERDNMFVRYTFSDGTVDRVPVSALPVSRLNEATRGQYVTAEHVRILTPSLFHILRLGFSRTSGETVNRRTLANVDALSFVPNSPFGYVTISGLTSAIGGDARVPRTDHLNNYQFSNLALWLKGNHSFKFGFTGQRQQFNTYNLLQLGGAVTFSNLSDFLQARPRSIDFSIPGAYDPVRGFRQTLAGGFVNDEYRVRENLTVHYGVRYEFASVPREVNGKISNLRGIYDSSLTVGDPYFSNPARGNFAPRVGFAWSPRGSTSTVVRGGWGLFHDLILPRYYFIAATRNPPHSNRVLLNNPRFPLTAADLGNLDTIKPSVNSFNPDVSNPYMMQFNLTVERMIEGWKVSGSYVGSRGYHLPRQAEVNLAPATLAGGVKTYQPQLGRQNPNYAGIVRVEMDARSFYNALQVQAVRQYSRGLRSQFSYTWSKSVDDSSGIVSSDFISGTQYTLDYLDRKLDRGLSGFHAAHVFVANGSWQMPFARSASGWRAAVAKGWQLHNITTVQSGHPFSLLMGFNRSGNLNTASLTFHDRPDVNPDFRGNPILGGPRRWWDPNYVRMPGLNQRGNLGRNTLLGPGLLMIDVALVKQHRWSDERTVQFRAEVFNLTNTPNFATPTGRTAYTNASGALASNLGAITSTVTSSRQVQLGLKFNF
jgi:hypothetical protein